MGDDYLDDRPVDRYLPALRGVAGLIPCIGTAVGELLTVAVPGQKAERVVEVLRIFSERLETLEVDLGRVEARLRSPEGLDLLEDGIQQATRALSEQRRESIANLLARGMTEEEFDHDRVKTVFRLLGQLSDAEIIHLMFYARPVTFGSPWHREYQERHRDIVQPVTREIGSPPKTAERAALFDRRLKRLEALGLLTGGRPRDMAALGRLLTRYIAPEMLEG